MSVTYKDIALYSQKASVAGTEKLPVSDTQYITPSQIAGMAFSTGAKVALLEALKKVAWTDANGQTYIDGLWNALLGDLQVSSLSAVYSPGTAVILDSMALDDLRPYLTVTATFSDGSTAVVTGYTLSGSLDAGTNTITATYGSFTATFTATALHNYAEVLSNWIYHPNNNGGTAAYSDGKIRMKCGNSSDVSNWSVWVADGKKTLWSAVNGKSVKVRMKVSDYNYAGLGAFGLGVYQSSSITSLGASYAKRVSLDGEWTLADDGYYETTSAFVCDIANFTSGTLSPGANATFGLWCYARSTSNYQEIYDVQIYEVTP